jgi:predicted AlkP superfamily phosphohydrolase/phosphomutase
MKICILGLDCCAPEVIFGDERLVNIRRLMDAGLYGRLQSVVPPITVPAWMCMSTSQDPGSLGIYGFRNRTDYSYEKLGFANSNSIKSYAMWDHLAREGKKSIIVGVPPNFPPRRINGISIGCFLTPTTTKDEFTYPTNIKTKINELVGEYPVDVKNFRTDRKDWLRDEIFAMSRKQWTVVKWLLAEQEWDYFHFVDIGLDRVHHGFWNYFDKQHVQYEPGNPYENVIPDYYLWLDEQIGSVLELLDNETILLVVSDHGAQRLDGGIAVNQWLIDQGREPQGVIPAADYEKFQDEIKAKFEAMKDDKGNPLKNLVFKPKEIYQNTRNVSPDLIVHFGGLDWRSIGTVGYPNIYVQENDTGPDGCNHAQYGMFLLAAPNCPINGEYEGAKLLDIAPTLLDLAGYEIPESMQGRSLVAGMEKRTPGDGADAENEKIIHDRLAGLGYV